MFPAWAWVAAAALALITGYTIRQMNNQNDQLAELRKQMKLATMQNQALQNQLDMDRMVASVMMSPDSMPLKLMPKDKNMPMVHAYLHPHMGVAITADQMPSMPSARTLQLWFVPKTGKPVSVAIFHPDAAGQIALVAPVNYADERNCRARRHRRARRRQPATHHADCLDGASQLERAA